MKTISFLVVFTLSHLANISLAMPQEDSIDYYEEGIKIQRLMLNGELDKAKLRIDSLYETLVHTQSRLGRAVLNASAAKRLQRSGEITLARKKLKENAEWFDQQTFVEGSSEDIDIYNWQFTNYLTRLQLYNAQDEYDSVEYVAYQAMEHLEQLRELYENDSALKAIHHKAKYVGSVKTIKGNLAVMYAKSGKLEQAGEVWEELAEFAVEQKDSIRAASLYENIGIASYASGDIPKAIEYNLKGLTYRPGRPQALRNLGQLYNSIGEFDLAKQYLMEATDQFMKSGMLNQQANTMRTLGDYYMDEGKYDSARLVLENSLIVVDGLGDDGQVVSSLVALAELEVELKNYETALDYLDEAKAISNADELSNVALTMSILRASCLFYLDQYDQALANAVDLTDHLENTQEVNKKIDGYRILHQLYRETGNSDMAYEYLLEYSTLKDSSFNDDVNRRVARAEYDYKLGKEKRDLQLQQEREELLLQAEISKQRLYTIIGISGFGVVALFLAIIAWAYRGKIKANAKLKELDQFKTRLFANINHDFRTPITLILGYVHRIRHRSDDYLSSTSHEDLENLEKNAAMLTEMTNEIQNLILLEEGKLELQLKPTNLNSYLNREIKMFESLAELSKINLQLIDKSSAQLNVKMDQNYFDKIIFNLMSNAFKFTPDEGTIEVVLEANATEVAISIRDTGKGIASKDLPHIFDRFYQSPLNEYRSKEGFGIGLAVVKELIDLHHGTIEVLSEEGKGTTFEISLPTTQQQPAEQEAMAVNSSRINTLPTKEAVDTIISRGDNGKPTVLVVDDHEEIRNYIVDIIKGTYVTKQAANGNQALKVLEKDEIDLIITDLMMPHLDGYGFIEALGESARLKEIPVMVVSARTSPEDRHKVLDAGVNEFISKPFDPTEFEKRINNILQRKTPFNGWDGLVEDGDTKGELDKSIINRLNQIILDHLKDPELTIEVIAAELSASRSKTIRMIKELTGKTPLAYIKMIRMNYVRDAIASGKVPNATEAARAIGMKNATQFSNQYKQRFGNSPFERVSS